MNGNEFCTEPEANNGNVESLVAHGWRKSRKSKVESQSHSASSTDFTNAIGHYSTRFTVTF